MPWLSRRKRAAWSEIFSDVCSQLGQSLEQHGILKNLTRTIKHSVNATRSSLLTPHDSRYFQMTAQHNLDSSYVEKLNTTHRIPIEGSPAGRAYASRTPIHIGNVYEDELFAPWREMAKSQGYRSLYLLPLVTQQRSIAVMGLYSNRPNNFTRHESFMQRLAGPLSVAVDRINLQNENFRLLDSMVRAIDLREMNTAYHSQRVASYTVYLSALIGRPREEWEMVYWGALLHDVGKIGVMDEVLLKTSELSQKEWELMRQHPQMGHSLVKDLQMLGAARFIAYCHHERWDGTGYPQGLKGEDIPILARIFSVADALDVITSHRPYKRAYSFEFAHEEISRCGSTQFDPTVVAVFESIPPEQWRSLREAFDDTFRESKPSARAVLELVESALRETRQRVRPS